MTGSTAVENLILASASPRRRKLLEQMGLGFTVHIPDITETFETGLNPAVIVERLADLKARVCCGLYPNSLVIGADTLVVLDGEVIGKPTNRDQAVKTLERLSGRTHSVFTGVSLLLTDRMGNISKQILFHEETKVTFATLTIKEIDNYVMSGSSFDKAGAYGIQDDMGALFVSGINGDFYNVVGLPIHRLYLHLKDIAPGILNRRMGCYESPA